MITVPGIASSSVPVLAAPSPLQPAMSPAPTSTALPAGMIGSAVASFASPELELPHAHDGIRKAAARRAAVREFDNACSVREDVARQWEQETVQPRRAVV